MICYCFVKKMQGKVQPICLLLCFTVSATDEVRLSRGKPTGQSSSLDSYVSSYAVDGNYGSNIYTDKCAHCTVNAWWSVDLMGVYIINSVVMYNRNQFKERLDNVFVEGFVKGDPYFCNEEPSLCGFNPGPSGDVVRMTCPNNTLARYVKLRGPRGMTLCEVDVFGQVYSENDCQSSNPHITSTHNFEKLSGRRLLTSLVDLGVAVSPTDCLVSCLRRGLCSVSNFNVITGSCVVTTHPVTDADITPDADWNVYYTC